MTPDPNIQIVTKPGGLSGAAHAVHILICVFTCGLWIPGYILFIAFSPARRIEVMAPYGTDPQLIAAARAQAEAVSPEQREINRRSLIINLIVVLALVGFCVGGVWATR